MQDTKVKHIHHLLKIPKTFLNQRYHFFPDTTIQKSVTFKFNIKSQSTFTKFKPWLVDGDSLKKFFKETRKNMYEFIIFSIGIPHCRQPELYVHHLFVKPLSRCLPTLLGHHRALGWASCVCTSFWKLNETLAGLTC